ncbi:MULTISPECIES: hypothetical protein [unclassified Alteromonas]|uniref:hypothetical protein n=1 Tax=unclassified Alteromonas TaxID=2614992 RepID=UPI00068E6BE4|nr:MULTISPECIES: hypothetical protein [unclassified Alteromonas]
MDFNSHFFSSMSMWAMLPVIATIIVHLAFSAAIFNDSSKLHDENHQLAFVGPVIWTLAVLVGGVFVAAVYWLIHHSALSKP